VKDILTSTRLDDLIPQGQLQAAVPLPSAFYRRNAALVARELLGKCLVHRLDGKFLAGIIVETEAYLADQDAASHSACGPTPRNAAMFADGGTCYVYLSYGINHCMNVVTGPEGCGEAVLIRALRPASFAGDMLRRRSLLPDGGDPAELPRARIVAISNGPGKLTMALGIGLADDRRDFFGPGLKIVDGDRSWVHPGVVTGPRIGISKAVDLPLRFYLAGSPWVSRPAGPAAAAR
jgi:DNA-3-methyladenine glycosylase